MVAALSRSPVGHRAAAVRARGISLPVADRPRLRRAHFGQGCYERRLGYACAAAARVSAAPRRACELSGLQLEVISCKSCCALGAKESRY